MSQAVADDTQGPLHCALIHKGGLKERLQANGKHGARL
jgi:hypothetical protein